MVLMTREQYIGSIRKLNLQIYMLGEKIESPVDHPILCPSPNSIRMTYDLTQDPQYEDLMTATSAITGNKTNHFCHIHHSTQDLVNKVKMQRLLGQKTTSCSRRCVGVDAFSALYFATFETDQQYKANYLENFKKFTIITEENDWMVDGVVTDSKGDRSLAPHAQPGADMYLYMVGRCPDGIIVRGTKTYQTDTTNPYEAIVMPTIAMGPDGRDHTVSFAVPTDTEGISMTIGHQSCDTRKLEDSEMDVGSNEFDDVEALVIFSNAFVPNGRIFLSGEVEFIGILVERFASYHRWSYGGYKVGVSNILIGAAALVAKYNGVERASTVKDKLIEMAHLNETLFAYGIAYFPKDRPTPSGNYLIDLLLANTCKQNVTRSPYEIVRLAGGTTGGLMVTAPSEKDLCDPVVGSCVDRYLHGINAVSTENRLCVLCLIENMSFGTAAAGYRTEPMHGAGPLQAQRIIIAHQGSISAKKRLAKTTAHID